MNKINLDIPIACTLSDSALARRRGDTIATLFQQAGAYQELEDGYAFRFPGTDEQADQLLDFIKFERRCCAFFTFALSFEPNQGHIWLSLRGGDGVKAFIQAELEINNMTGSKNYFANVAEEWDEIRSGFFTEAMRDAAIERAGLPELAIVADVGTGTGFVLQGLANHAAELVGFDESAEMLEVARRNLAGHPHLTLRQAEGQNLPAEDDTFDAVFANMYLHHAPQPSQAIREMTRILKPGGKLVITDLDSHDQGGCWKQWPIDGQGLPEKMSNNGMKQQG